MQEQKFKIIKVNKGIANRFPGRVIEIHKGLYNSGFDNLREEILEHEKKHTDHWNISDFILDIKGFKNKFEYWAFVCCNPSSWWQFSPIYKSSWGQWYWDITLLLTYGFIAILFGVVGWILI